VVPRDWIERHAWLSWEAPRNYIAGEASYLKALERLTGPPCPDGYCLPVVVRLVREPRNEYDANAIRAEVAGTRIGYLRRHLAAQLAPGIDRARMTEFHVAGLLRGGSTRTPNVGCHVWLDRSVTDDGPAITLPQEDEWTVPWPINDWERPQVVVVAP
jgi:hypothetical protein